MAKLPHQITALVKSDVIKCIAERTNKGYWEVDELASNTVIKYTVIGESYFGFTADLSYEDWFAKQLSLLFREMGITSAYIIGR